MVRRSVPDSSKWTAKAPQTVRGSRLGDGATAAGLLTSQFHGTPADVLAWDVARKEPRWGLFYAPPVAQNLQEPGRQHHVAILLALPLIDANHHPRAIDIRQGEAARF